MPGMSSTIRSIILSTLCCAVIACSGSAQTPEASPPENTLGEGTSASDPDSGENAALAPVIAETPAADRSATNPDDDSDTDDRVEGGVTPLSKEELMIQMKEVMLALAEAIKSTAGDCDAMAEALQPVLAAAPALKARGDELEKDPETKAWLDEQGKAVMEEIMPSLMEAMSAAESCKDHPGVREQMQAL